MASLAKTGSGTSVILIAVPASGARRTSGLVVFSAPLASAAAGAAASSEEAVLTGSDAGAGWALFSPGISGSL